MQINLYKLKYRNLQPVDSYVACLEERVKSECLMSLINKLVNPNKNLVSKGIVPCLENAESSVLIYSNFVFGFAISETKT
jgi:hypothetical protein